MKRFHVQVSVADLAKSVNFYATLFGTPPSRPPLRLPYRW